MSVNSLNLLNIGGKINQWSCHKCGGENITSNEIIASAVVVNNDRMEETNYLASEEIGTQQTSDPIKLTVTTHSSLPPNESTPSPSPNNPHYSWKTVEYGKRPRNSSSPENVRSRKQTTLNDYWLSQPVRTANTFGVLTEEKDDVETAKVVKPPPIFVEGVECIKPLTELLDTMAVDNYTTKSLSNNRVKIQPSNVEHYSKITKALEEKKTMFHTYQMKQDRTFRVVIRNIHPTTIKEDLKKAIEQEGHEVINISGIQQKGTKIWLPLFNIELKVKTNNKDVYKITKLLNNIVIVEPPHPKREVPQCSRCQRFGHTKKYCHLTPRCVKCTGNHATVQCLRRERDGDVMCVNCGEKHPANYKGCKVYKELQKKRYPPLRRKEELNQPTTHNTFIRQGVNYAKIAKTNSQAVQADNNLQQNYVFATQQQPQNNLEQMMTKMMEKMDRMLDLLGALIIKIK